MFDNTTAHRTACSHFKFEYSWSTICLKESHSQDTISVLVHEIFPGPWAYRKKRGKGAKILMVFGMFWGERI